MILVVLFALSCYGWGRLVAARIEPRLLSFSSVTMALGLAVLTALGGWLNLAMYATPVVLLFLLATGVVVTVSIVIRGQPVLRSKRNLGPPRTASTFRALLWLKRNWLILVSWLLTALAAYALVPSSVFNLWDDLHTYLVRPLRMLATGSVAGNPFDFLGLDGLGAQSFLQGFFVADGDLRKIHGFDAVFCFGLCLMMLAEAACRWRIPKLLGVLALLSFIFINPQAVNTSPLYSGTVSIMGMVLASVTCEYELGRGAKRYGRIRRLLIPALFLSLAASLKATVMLAALGFYMLFWIMSVLRSSDRRRSLLNGIYCLLVVGLILLPWVLNVLPTIVQSRGVATRYAEQASLSRRFSSMAERDAKSFFGVSRLFYGNKLADYQILIGFSIAVGVVCALAVRRRLQGVWSRRAIGAAALAGAVFATVLGSIHLFGLMTGMRYACPAVLAGFPLLTVLILSVGRCALRLRERQCLWAGVGGIQLVALALFCETAVRRFHVAFEKAAILSYGINDRDEAYSRYALSQPEGVVMQTIQRVTEPKQRILAWTVAPCRFDFARNSILSLSESGLINPAIAFPAGIPPDALQAYFQALGVRYVILERKGDGPLKSVEELRTLLYKPLVIDRKLGEYAIYAHETLWKIATTNRILYADGRFVVVELRNSSETGNRPPQGKN